MPKSSKGSTRTRKSAPAAKKERPAAKAKAVVAAAPPAVSDAPRSRRAVFIDVENTSSEAALIGALEQLVIDRQARPTEVVAVGNWRVISHQVARMLAQRGARLLHSAPATGVKDWSDLAIAVHAGIWLGRSFPGDVIEIISADRAFDAVSDAAMSLGVVCNRLTYGGGARHAADAADEDSAGPRRRRRGRRGNGRRASSPPPVRSEPSRAAVRSRSAAAQPAIDDDEDRHSASHQQIIATVARLTARDPARGVNLDLLINALKGEGFLRPPGSPRLVTRLRKMKDVEVSSTGMVRLAGEAAPGPALAAAPAVVEPTATAGEAEAEAAPPAEAETKAPAKRRRSRGGRGRRKRGAAPSGGGDDVSNASPTSAETAASSDDAELQSA